MTACATIETTRSRRPWGAITPLMGHQAEAVAKLLPARVGGAFMEMGTGKTRTAVELARLRQHKIDQMRKRAEAKQDGRVEVLLFVSRQVADRLTELGIRRGCTRAEVVEKLILQADEFSRGE